jgi:hypothetical protein
MVKRSFAARNSRRIDRATQVPQSERSLDEIRRAYSKPGTDGIVSPPRDMGIMVLAVWLKISLRRIE